MDFWWIIPLLLIFLLHHNNLEMTCNMKFPVPPILYLSSKITKTGRPFDFFGKYLDSNCRFQYMSTKKLYSKKCYSKPNFLFEKMKYLSNTCNITAYAVIWMPTDDSNPPHEDDVMIPSTQEYAVRHTEGMDPIMNAIIPGTVQSVIDSCDVTTIAIQCTEGQPDIPDVITQSAGQSCNVTSWPVQCTEGHSDILNVKNQSTGESSDVDTSSIHITDGYWDTPSGTIPRAAGIFNVNTTAIQCTEGPLDIPDVITQSTGENSDVDPRAVHITDEYCDIHAGTDQSAGESCDVTITAIQCTDRPTEIPSGIIQMGAACTWRSLEGELSMSPNFEGNSTTHRIEQSTDITTFIRIPNSNLLRGFQNVCIHFEADQHDQGNRRVLTCNPMAANRSTVSTVTMVPGRRINSESNPVIMNEQPVGVDDLANIIQRLCQRGKTMF